MKNKNLGMLVGAAAVLAVGAWFTSAGSRVKTPSLVGKALVPSFDLGAAEKLAVTGEKKLTLAAKDNGWVIETAYGYPADVSKIRENLLKLLDLKVGQTAGKRPLGKETKIVVSGANGKELAAVTLGDKHMKKASGQAAMYGGGGYPDGRYARVGDATVLLKDTLDAFDGDVKSWTDAKIASVTASDVEKVVYTHGKESFTVTRKDGNWSLAGLGPKEELDTSKTYGLDSALSYLDFNAVADPAKAATYGFETGAVYAATLKNGLTYTAVVGNKADGSDRYVKLSASFAPRGTNAVENANLKKTADEFNASRKPWVYAISSYSADNLAKKRADIVKAKEEPKKDDSKKADAKKTDAKKADAKK